MVIAIMLVVILFLSYILVKYLMLRKCLSEIVDDVSTIFNEDTNALLRVSSDDKFVKKFAVLLNGQLQEIRKERLSLQSKNEDIQRIITNISHDLRTPLTAIGGYLELLEMQDKSEDVARYLDIISERTNALKGLTEELFQYSVSSTTSATQLEIEDLCLNDALEVALTGYYGALVEHNIDVNVDICEKKIIRKADSKATQRIFSNVLNNVIKYSDGDVRVTLKEDGTIIIANKTEGMDNVNLEKLFDRFFTVENARGSTGLGLSIARLLIEKMNGTIDATYKDGIFSIIIKYSQVDN